MRWYSLLTPPRLTTAAFALAAGSIVWAAPETPPAKTAGPEDFTSEPAKAAYRRLNFGLDTVQTEFEKTAAAALNKYVTELGDTQAEAMAAKHLDGANEIEAVLKLVEHHRDALAEAGGPPRCPKGMLGHYRQLRTNNDLATTVDLSADHVLRRSHNNSKGVWYVQGKTLVFCWPDRAIDRFEIQDDPSAEMPGRSSGGENFRLIRDTKAEDQ